MLHARTIWLGERMQGVRSVRASTEMDLGLVRLMDILLAASVLIFLAPLMIAVAIAVRLSDGGPILFGHMRLGQNGRAFKCFKFRSMVVDAEARLEELLLRDAKAREEWNLDQKLRNDPRVTSVGSFLRKSSLDELPQLLNVLRGEMSLVGPRPIVKAEVVRYGHYYSHYCSVRPGLTGLWQISGRNDVSYRRRVALDVAYARARGVGLYLKILTATVPAVLTRRGAA
jgi:lipopolysaccharide/colanic/teichoic acid biosynthesis glycosyltransferase